MLFVFTSNVDAASGDNTDDDDAVTNGCDVLYIFNIRRLKKRSYNRFESNFLASITWSCYLLNTYIAIIAMQARASIDETIWEHTGIAACSALSLRYEEHKANTAPLMCLTIVSF
uniref:Uncharacterized protein n=1 Tax=Glossina brevipalpis TaxID=37001 RepID=A0A1A9W7U1_9MUSC